MSQATVRQLSGNTTQQGLDGLLSQLPGLVNTATTQYVGLLRRGLQLAGDVLPSRESSGSESCCTVPTQDCPPRCVAEIDWEDCACEAQRAVITVRNTGTVSRDFAFHAGELGPVKIEVSPTSAALAPGQSVAVTVVVPGSEAFKAGETYTGELLIRGAYEQCVRLSRRVTSPVVAQLEVAQGDQPQRITELKWYRHWQCTDTCGPRDVRDIRPIDPKTGREAVDLSHG